MWINRKKVEALQAQLEAAHAALQQVEKRAFIIDITRDGKLNKFMFACNGKVHVIETMGLLSDNVEEWKEQLCL